MTIARSRRAERGFTLIEILIVLVIIGILAMLATLSIGLLGEDREIENESGKLADAIALLQEQAQLEGRDYGIVLETSVTNSSARRVRAALEGVDGDAARDSPAAAGLVLELVIEARRSCCAARTLEARVPQLVAWGSAR
jgi:type II secretion system protein H